jgi:hypothetical protein
MDVLGREMRNIVQEWPVIMTGKILRTRRTKHEYAYTWQNTMQGLFHILGKDPSKPEYP